MLLQREATVLAISTVLGSDNSYSQLMERRDPKTGKPIFKSIRLNLRCHFPACANSNTICYHIAPMIPSWHSIASHAAARVLLSGSPAVLNRELIGEVTDEGVVQFKPPELIDAAFAPAPKSHSGRVRFAVVSVDPNNCGASEYAIVSAVYSEGQMIVIGMDTSTNGSIENLERLFRTHVQTLLRRLENVHIYLAVESNMSMDGGGLHESWLLKMGVPRDQFTSLRERGGSSKRATNCRGVVTTHDFKVAATDDFLDSLKEGRICLAKSLFSVEGGDYAREAREQLYRWTKFSTPARTAGGAAKVWIGGKGKTGALQDDLAMCLLINHAVSRMLMGKYGQKYGVAAVSRLGSLHDEGV